MPMQPSPIPTMPDWLRSTDPQTWAHQTVAQRLPDIARRVLTENQLPGALRERVLTLVAELPQAVIRPLVDPGAPDLEDWNRWASPYFGQDWLAVPWFFAEHYFYRRLMEALGYFQAGEGWALDPFFHQKRQGFELSRPAIRTLVERVADCVEPGLDDEQVWVSLLYQDLWGNQADLSLWPAEGGQRPDHGSLEQAQAFLLADDAARVARELRGRDGSQTRIDLLLDNAGFELVADLVLVDRLLTCARAAEVRLHVKAHPTFVSDALRKDVEWTLLGLQLDAHPAVAALGQRLFAALDAGRLQLRPDFFWTAPCPAWEMPVGIRAELGQADLVISKGDANYRRLLGDRDWPAETPFEAILAYYPAPILALRTVKAELICGLQPGQAAAVAAKDPAWMVNGRWGLIQYKSFCR